MQCVVCMDFFPLLWTNGVFHGAPINSIVMVFIRFFLLLSQAGGSPFAFKSQMLLLLVFF